MMIQVLGEGQPLSPLPAVFDLKGLSCSPTQGHSGPIHGETVP